jgi:hypothetical protein
LSEYQRIERYTRQRMREIRGEVSSVHPMDPDIERYTRSRIRELRLERKIKESEVNIDNVLFRVYAMATMEVYGGD